jgi:hypothetical protein
MEDRLVELLDASNVPCLLLGRLTHGGTRELAFQVADFASFRPPVGCWIREHSDYDTDVSEHDGWKFFFDSVWPDETSWDLIFDRRVVDNLVKSGSNPSKTHSLEFVFRGNQSGLKQMQTALAAKGYTLVGLSGEESRLMMARCMALDVGEIFKETLSHRENCRHFGIEYDGWGALIVS